MATGLTCADTAQDHGVKPANPYLQEFLAVHRELRVIPDGDLRFDPATGAALRSAREDLVRRYAWAVPNTLALRAIAAHGPVVELGAGNGYWSMLLEAAGVDVVAYDADPTAQNPYTNGDPWFEVRTGGVESIDAHQDRTLLLCWPPRNDPFACDALAAYQGDTVCYVGEGWGGCTAPGEFFDELQARFTRIERVSIPTWLDLGDDLSIWVRDR